MDYVHMVRGAGGSRQREAEEKTGRQRGGRNARSAAALCPAAHVLVCRGLQCLTWVERFRREMWSE